MGTIHIFAETWSLKADHNQERCMVIISTCTVGSFDCFQPNKNFTHSTENWFQNLGQLRWISYHFIDWWAGAWHFGLLEMTGGHCGWGLSLHLPPLKTTWGGRCREAASWRCGWWEALQPVHNLVGYWCQAWDCRLLSFKTALAIQAFTRHKSYYYVQVVQLPGKLVCWSWLDRAELQDVGCMHHKFTQTHANGRTAMISQ